MGCSLTKCVLTDMVDSMQFCEKSMALPPFVVTELAMYVCMGEGILYNLFSRVPIQNAFR